MGEEGNDFGPDRVGWIIISFSVIFMILNGEFVAGFTIGIILIIMFEYLSMEEEDGIDEQNPKAIQKTNRRMFQDYYDSLELQRKQNFEETGMRETDIERQSRENNDRIKEVRANVEKVRELQKEKEKKEPERKKKERERKKKEREMRLMEERNSNKEETGSFETNNQRRIREREQRKREREERQKNAKINAFKRKNFQSEHALPTNSQKERAWTGKCYVCKKSSIQTELSFWWKIYPNLEVVSLCDKCAKKEGLIEEQEIIAEKRSRTIPDDVKDAVWRRDEGKCTQCGSNENLEFDHIIPHSKGGANTKRNIQLLCESCNRKKSDKIG